MKKSLLRFLAFVALLAVTARAADDKIIAAVRAADDERLAAAKAADRAKLEAILSDDLHYVHSSGKIDNKTSYLQGIATSANRYEDFEFKERTFMPAAPGFVLMYGRVLVHMGNTKTGAKTTNDINYLAVWREEKGKWRFLAWQSARLPLPEESPTKKK